MPKVSIITICYNDVAGIKKTIDSVASQSYRDYEHIVIDAGSTDGSKEIILANTDKLSYWVSEPDHGRYDGMNKGIKQARGEYCHFLNSGDVYSSPDVLQHVISELDGTCVITGKTNFINGNNVFQGEPFKTDEITMLNFWTLTLSHPASFIRTDKIKKYYYDDTLNIVADWKLFVQLLIIDGESYKPSSVYVADFNTEGISSKHPEKRFEERELVYSQLFPKKIVEDYKSMYNLCFLSDLSNEIKDEAKFKINVHRFMKLFLKVYKMIF